MTDVVEPRIIRGDARDLPIPDSSVDLVACSPPYFQLRSYRDGGEHYDGQVGSEGTPESFVDALLDCTREMMRVLKPSGSIFVNLGDKYGPNKSLMLLPHRYAAACADRLGLIVRQDQVWSKCLSGGTMVYARTKGRVQTINLHDLCRHYRPEDVQLWTGEKWSQVRAWEATPRGEAQFEIELRSGERIGCTPEHRWPTSRGLLRSDELAVGDVLDTCTLPAGEVAPSALDDEMVGWFVGLYIAEGSRSEQTIQIAGHVNELERYKRLCEIAEAFHGTCRVHATGGNKATINLTGGILRAILDTYVGGRTAKDKFLAPKCWQRSNAFLSAVLDGYLSGDGHFDKVANRWRLGFTDNDALAADLRALGARLGLSVRLRRTTHTGFGREWPGWGGSIVPAERRREPDSEIVAIRPSRARQFWDLAIEDEPHLFSLASGVLTHNSNGLPESVVDRTRRSHEYVFHLTKSPRYFAAVDEIREPVAVDAAARNARYTGQYNGQNPHRQDKGAGWMGANPLGKLPGSVWEIATQPLRVPAELGVDHFAAWPMEIPRRLILGWSPREVCTACGEGRRPVKNGPWHFAEPSEEIGRRALDRALSLGITAHEVAEVYGLKALGKSNQADETYRAQGGALTERMGGSWSYAKMLRSLVKRERSGYACACPDTSARVAPGVVLDPFGGTGTTALVAAMHGRQGISVDASQDYCRLAEWRVNDPKQRERASRAAGSKPAKPNPRSTAEVVALPTRPDPADALSLFDPLDGTAS